MDRRIDYREIAPDAYDALHDIGEYVESSDLDAILVEFIKLRTSQLNNCAYCVDLHTRRARELGADDRRIAAVSAWRESPFFTDRERAAFALTGALTRMGCDPVPKSTIEAARDHFSEDQLVAIAFTIIQMNSFNRLWVTFRIPEIPDL